MRRGQTFKTVDEPPDANKNKSTDVDLSDTEYASLKKEFLELADIDNDPYILLFGCGNYEAYKETDIHKAYTVYFMIYWPDKDSDPWFFDGEEWSHTYPWTSSNIITNNFTINGESVKIQLYRITSMSVNEWTKLNNLGKK